MTTVAIVSHSGYGHTAEIAREIAAGAQAASVTVNALAIEGAGQDFQPLLDAVTAADAVIFGAPTYMGDVSAAFRAFAEASSQVWFTQGWKDKLAAGFTNSLSFSGDKVNALQSLSVLAAQHGMIWVGQGEPPPGVPAAERGPDTVNRAGHTLGLGAQSDNAAPSEINAGERETARRFGRRVAESAIRWKAGAQAALRDAA
ncbi:flavodoxin family protein [soil metagenome]